MVGVNSPTAFSGGGGSQNVNSGGFSSASAAPTGSGGREQRISSKPLHPGPSSQMDPFPVGGETEKILDQLTLSDATLKKIMELMNAEMEKGLYPDTHEQV